MEFVTNRDTFASFLDAIVDAVQPVQRFFRTEREVAFAKRGTGLISVTEETSREFSHMQSCIF